MDETYQHGNPIVVSIEERDQLVVVVEFTTDDQLPDEQTLILERGQYEALCRHIRADVLAAARKLVASWDPDYTDERWALAELLDHLGLDDVEYERPEAVEMQAMTMGVAWICPTMKPRQRSGCSPSRRFTVTGSSTPAPMVPPPPTP